VKLQVAVFASGGGTNLQALLHHFGDGHEVARIALVVSDRAEAGALERAERAGVETRVVAAKGREAGDLAEELLGALRAARIDLVVLAGYLRLMPAEVVRAYRGRMLNIHPALLPAFGGRGMYGAHIHRAVLAAGCTVSGVTIHYVDERYDTGPVLVQWPVPVLPADTAESLAARVLAVEHQLLPLAVEMVAGAIAAGVAGVIGAAGMAGAVGESSEMPHAGERSAEVVFGLMNGVAPTEQEVRRLLGMEEG
jgi:formyltetrahydrofolate-dependent phosphoribosylglycinamide formyltransferase